MKYLFIDTETTGLPKDDNLSPMITDNWPRLVSLAYILCDERDIVDRNFFIIKPNKYIIPIESTKIHGITTAEAVSNGVALSEVLDIIRPLIERCDFIVGHNVVFDINVLNAEFYRYNMTLPVSLRPYYCTMQLSKNICGLPDNKYPTLEELYSILKGESISNVHNAMTDTQASMECFWILEDSGIVDSTINKPTIKIYPTEDNIIWVAEHIDMEYAAKAYAFLTLVCNLINNKSVFLKPIDDLNSLESLYGGIDERLLNTFDDKSYKEVEKNYPNLIGTKDPNTNVDWIDTLFTFLEEDIQKSIAYARINKFTGKRTIITKSHLINVLRDSEKEFGIKELIDKFLLKYPQCPKVSLCLEDDSIWTSIVLESVRIRTQQTSGIRKKQLSQLDARNYLISMIEYFNYIRDTERIKRVDEGNNALEKSFDTNTLKDTEDLIKNYSSPYSSSSSGCMLLLSLFVGIGSSLCFLISFLINHQ